MRLHGRRYCSQHFHVAVWLLAWFRFFYGHDHHFVAEVTQIGHAITLLIKQAWVHIKINAIIIRQTD